MIDPTIALGFRSPAASADSSQTSTLATLSQLMGLRQLLGRLRGGQSLGGFMTGAAPDYAPAPAAPVTAAGDAVAVPGPSTPPATQLPTTGTSGLMTGLSRYGENVYSHDGGKTWFSGQTGQPVTGDIWGQTTI
jgi:hypothetical protein